MDESVNLIRLLENAAKAYPIAFVFNVETFELLESQLKSRKIPITSDAWRGIPIVVLDNMPPGEYLTPATDNQLEIILRADLSYLAAKDLYGVSFERWVNIVSQQPPVGSTTEPTRPPLIPKPPYF